jgi:DNA-binding transcriptional MerR regulator
MPGAVDSHDPLQNLREYRHLAPWNLRDLAALAAAILDVAAVRPVSAAAAALPSERTIRFYVAKHLVAPPEGRGTAATYSYRHLLQVLAIKLRQMEGASLTALAEEMATTSGDVLERRVAHVLGPGLPAPRVLPLVGNATRPRGRAGRAFHHPTDPPADAAAATAAWRRLPVADGVELHVREDQPIAADPTLTGQLTEAVNLAFRRLAPAPSPSDAPTERPDATSASSRSTREKSI